MPGEGVSLLHPGSSGAPRFNTCMRYTLLFFSVFVVFSGYFSFDLPSITSRELKAPPLSLSNTQLGLLFSVYAIPNAVLPLFSGAFFERLGLWRGVISIAVLKTIGVCIVALGVGVSSFPTIVFGRVLYGLGGESLYVGIDVLTTIWFKGSELGLAYGLVQGAGQGGSFGAFLAVPPLVEATGGGILAGYALGAVLALTAVAMLVVGRCIDRVREKEAAEGKAAAAAEEEEAAAGGGETGDGASPPPAPLRGLFAACVRSPVMRFLGFHHLLGLSAVFWCHLVSICMYSGSFFTFLAFGNDFLQDKYGVSSAQSGRLVGALSLSSIVLSPLAGLAMDKFGGHEAASCAAMAVSAVCFALYGFADLPAWPVTALAGVCYGILPAALYPMLADVVPEESFAHVYAILTAGINLVLATSTVISGAISDTDIEISRRRRELRSWGGGAFADPLPPVQPLPRPDYSGVFAMFVIYCAIGTATTAWPLFVKVQAAFAARRRRVRELAPLLLAGQTPDALARGRSAVGMELQPFAREGGFQALEAE